MSSTNSSTSSLPPIAAPAVSNNPSSSAPSLPVTSQASVEEPQQAESSETSVAVHPRSPSSFVSTPAAQGHLYPPATGRGLTPSEEDGEPEGEVQTWEDGVADMVLELADGTGFEGVGFGAKGKSAGGECVFQTGKQKSHKEKEGAEELVKRVISGCSSSPLSPREG